MNRFEYIISAVNLFIREPIYELRSSVECYLLTVNGNHNDKRVMRPYGNQFM